MTRLAYSGMTTAGLAIAGAAVLWAGAPDVGVGTPGSPAPATAPAVALASFDSVLGPKPLAPGTEPWWLDEGGHLIGPAASAAPTRLLIAGIDILTPIGPGGWLIGDGLDALPDCTGSACNGGNAGFLWGNGGDG